MLYRGFFPHHSTEIQISTTKGNFLKHFSAAPGKFVSRNGDAGEKKKKKKSCFTPLYKKLGSKADSAPAAQNQVSQGSTMHKAGNSS